MPRLHKKLQRLYVSADLQIGQNVALDKGQSNYLANVLRKNLDDEVVVFNGREGAWLSRIITLSRKSVVLECVECFENQPTPADIWYGFAPLKSARLDYVVQKATEMGVSAMQPVLTHHTQNNRLKIERIKANAIEAAEQCEVLNVPDVRPQISFAALLDNWPKDHAKRVLIVADEEAPADSPVEILSPLKGMPLGLLIGPEGGFSTDERARMLCMDFVMPISLGPRILRADTAAVAALAIIQSTIGDWADHR